jgi:hypothetical protein
VSSITVVNVPTVGHLTIELGDTKSFGVQAEDNLMECLEPKMVNATLVIGTPNGVILCNTQQVHYILAAENLDMITVSSVGDIETQDLASDEADVRLTSTGGAVIWVRGRLKAELTSAADLRYRGNLSVDATTTSTDPVTRSGDWEDS